MKVLLAEDHVDSRLVLESVLTQWGYDVVVAPDGESACRLLQGDDPPQLALLDWMMPGLDGLQLCREIRSWQGRPYTYILLLTARTGKQDIVEGLRAGADDYLAKPIDLNELEARLRSGQRVLELQSQLIAAREALRDQALHDALTGLWNRSAILDIFQRELARSRREGFPIGVLMADLDHFKHINDTHGHQAGDTVLRAVAARMRASLRPYDTISRYGGEEFLVVLPGCTLANTLQLADRLRLSLAGEPVPLATEAVSVTLSLGVTACHDPHQASIDSLITAADAALYRAKNAGRNRVEVWKETGAGRSGHGKGFGVVCA